MALKIHVMHGHKLSRKQAIVMLSFALAIIVCMELLCAFHLFTQRDAATGALVLTSLSRDGILTLLEHIAFDAVSTVEAAAVAGGA
jgi:hypothetical protein